MNNKIAPPIVIPDHINVLMPEKHTASNGVEMYSICTGTQDVIRISLVFHAGVKFQQKAFASSATVNMLAEGTASKNAKQLAELLDFYGIYFDANIDRDYAVVTVCCLTKFLPQTLDFLNAILTEPVFPDKEFAIYKEKRKQELRIHREKIDYLARERFAEQLFGKDHPYGVSYHEDCYDGLDVDDLKGFFKQFYTAGNCFCVISGKISTSHLEDIAQVVANIPAGTPLAEVGLGAACVPYQFEDKKEVLQSAIRMGKVLFNRNHRDFIGMQVLCTVLGGYFGSRLVKNLREEKGYTYGIYSAMINLEQSGYLAIGTEVAAQFTDDAVAQIHFEIDRLKKQLVPNEELEMVKNVMFGEVMRILDGPFGIADVTIENIQNGKNNDFLNHFINEIRAITPRNIQQLACRYLDQDSLVTVIVGKNN